jgi:hypothetical protein
MNKYGPPPPDRHLIEPFCRLVMELGAIHELRALQTPKGTVSGYFDDPKKMVPHASAWSGRAMGVYLTLNPVNPALHSRAFNRVKEYSKDTTADKDILHRRWLMIDCDPKRPTGISSTDAEHALALQLATDCRDFLCEQGWPEPIELDTGNGATLLYPIDLPNDEGSLALLKQVLKSVAARFNTDAVEVDQVVTKAAGLVRIAGTANCKGDSTPDRPHRLVRLLHVPSELAPAPVERLQEIAALFKEPEPEPARARPTEGGTFDIDRWITAHFPDATEPASYEGGRKWVLAQCPFNPDHQAPDAAVFQRADGKLGFRCLHDSCKNYDWHALRDRVEPGWRNGRGTAWDKDNPPGASPGSQSKANREGDKSDISDKSNGNSDLLSQMSHMSQSQQERKWPEKLAEEAFHGVAGEITRAIEPHSEADPAGILTSTLVQLGSVIGRKPHFLIEGARHGTNLFVAHVGETSKARKGTAQARAEEGLKGVDPSFAPRVRSGLSSGEGVIDHVRDDRTEEVPVKVKGRYTGDYDEVVHKGVDDKRLLTVETEFSSPLKVMKREGNTLSPVLRNAWDNRPLATMTRNNPLNATGAHISIIGQITEEELMKHLTETEAANGFANRFLWFAVKRSKKLSRGGGTPQLKRPIGRLEQLIPAAKQIEEVDFDEDAGRIWDGVYDVLSEGQPGMFGAITARAEAQTLRLATLYAVLDASCRIRREHLFAALAIWDYAEASALYLWGDASGDWRADAIFEELQKRSQMTRTEIRDFFNRHSSKQVDQALALLKRLGRATSIEKEEKDTDGRPPTIWIATGGGTTSRGSHLARAKAIAARISTDRERDISDISDQSPNCDADPATGTNETAGRDQGTF